MPDDTMPKKWCKVNKADLHDLIKDGLMDINNLSTKSINAIHAQYFRCHKHGNFRCNVRNFAAGNALESEYSGSRRQQGESLR